MKKFAFFCLAALTLMACNNDEPTTPTINYDFLIGTWNVNNYSVVITNLDEGKEIENISRNSGTLTVTKETEDGDVYYYYTENFINPEVESYSGRFEFTKNSIEMNDREGSLRSDVEYIYDYTISSLTDKKMEWTYESEKTVSSGGKTYTRKVVSKAVFTKQ